MTNENIFAKEVDRATTLTITENGGVAYKDTVVSPIVRWIYNIADNRAKINSMRNDKSVVSNIEKKNSIVETELVKDIVKESNSISKDLLARLLGYVRDPRRGMGERSLFRTVLTKFIDNGIFKPISIHSFCDAVVEYGRYDDLIAIMFNVKDSEFKERIGEYIRLQLAEDFENMKENKPISLLAKWMPSINTSSKATKSMARYFIVNFGLTEKSYRKTLSKMREYLNVTERNVCQNTFEKIDYSEVPSLAMNKYKGQFERKDNTRFNLYLESLKSGETKINASVINPCELITEYRKAYQQDWSGNNRPVVTDTVIEEQWKALPDVSVEGNVMPVMDLSGSMYTNITDKIQCLDVAVGMGIYISQHNKGVFKDKAMIFGSETSVVDFSGCETLAEKASVVGNQRVGYSTNVERALNTVLDMAVRSNCPQSDIPTLVFITDSEFNAICDECEYNTSKLDTVFEKVGKRYKEKGYALPKLVFWNTQNRSSCVPLKENENGLVLMSGFSQNICNMISSNNLDPLQAILDELNKEWLDNSTYFFM